MVLRTKVRPPVHGDVGDFDQGDLPSRYARRSPSGGVVRRIGPTHQHGHDPHLADGVESAPPNPLGLAGKARHGRAIEMPQRQTLAVRDEVQPVARLERGQGGVDRMPCVESARVAEIEIFEAEHRVTHRGQVGR